ncbi:hypothetical protein [Salegentibacter salegens]|uniref:Uncharacterized protein n=1 Tax=Salegentibacter salegens TaxID=143223 RepID=A0A1M7K338_9FLAO|nr:hypothetical protein [Salegentibacter salegens]PRX41945.1 hypothetical protein LY58_02892 [Salegentibacter salegens]SHM59686.1 hypothetical protein SAMN05878281_1226 [Salegentibacter salegens]
MGFSFYLTADRGRYLIPVLYVISGSLYAFLAYKQSGRNTEYITWDDEKLIVARLHQKPKTYHFTPEVNIHLSNYHLIIKAPKATGDMVELKGFTEEDLDLLREKFAKPAVA